MTVTIRMETGFQHKQINLLCIAIIPERVFMIFIYKRSFKYDRNHTNKVLFSRNDKIYDTLLSYQKHFHYFLLHGY